MKNSAYCPLAIDANPSSASPLTPEGTSILGYTTAGLVYSHTQLASERRQKDCGANRLTTQRNPRRKLQNLLREGRPPTYRMVVTPLPDDITPEEFQTALDQYDQLIEAVSASKGG